MWFEIRESDGNDCWITYLKAQDIQQVERTILRHIPKHYRRKIEEDWQSENEVIIYYFAGRGQEPICYSWTVSKIEESDMLSIHTKGDITNQV